MKIMKKTYIKPATEVLATIAEELMAGSAVSGDNGIEFGGIDETGELPPASRWFFERFGLGG